MHGYFSLLNYLISDRCFLSVFGPKKGRGQVEKVDLLRYFWKIDLEKIYFFYFFDLYFCFLKAFFGLKYTS